MKCPKMENLSLKEWSRRTISSRTFMDGLLPSMNWDPLVGLGNIPALRREVEFGSTMQEGIVLFGNEAPGEIPAGGTPPGQLAPRFATPVGTVIVVGKTAPEPGPFASGYSLASGTVWFKS